MPDIAMKPKAYMLPSWLLLDKPCHMSSQKAVLEVENIFQAKKAGHAGTLDPLADGLLPIALNGATKSIPFVQNLDKAYEFSLEWGKGTTTDDKAGEVINISSVVPNENDVRRACLHFLGGYNQTPPDFSAKHIKGQRAYQLARAKKPIHLPACFVKIDKLEVLAHDKKTKTARFFIQCSKGTYIRALARDLGLYLGSFAHISSLSRIKVGRLDKKDAISLDTLYNLRHKGDRQGLHKTLWGVDEVLAIMPKLCLTPKQIDHIKQGRAVFIEELQSHLAGQTILAMENKQAIALGICEGKQFKPKKILVEI